MIDPIEETVFSLREKPRCIDSGFFPFYRVVAIQPVTFFHSVPKAMELLGIDSSRPVTLAAGEVFDCRYETEQEQLVEMFPEQLKRG
jgi:hypothetical protein